MKKTGILNSQLNALIANLSHTDTFVIADSGFPVAPGVPIVDLRVIYGIPKFAQVLDAVVPEVAIEGGWYASEMPGANAESFAALSAAVPGLEAVSHDELKAKAANARFVVRTAEDTPYANVLLIAGVAFM
ncbi:D-ribose pyranase [Microbacterium sp.]|uniref:D-ribose pyranase n=1 Tax=Microbacterium sp. TaxID=51671 RepID=UPI0025EB9FAE|nr:D-ribose pyranase [Microbacterium sp.]